MIIAFAGDKLLVGTRTGEKISSETKFYYKLSKILSILGLDCIRKEMAKDGHLVDDGRFYAVDRKRRFGFHQMDWATYDVCKDYFNKNQLVALAIDTFEESGVGIIEKARKDIQSKDFQERISKKALEVYGVDIVSFGVLPDDFGYGNGIAFLEVDAKLLGQNFNKSL